MVIGCLYTCLQNMFWNQEFYKQRPAKQPLSFNFSLTITKVKEKKKLTFIHLSYITSDNMVEFQQVEIQAL